MKRNPSSTRWPIAVALTCALLTACQAESPPPTTETATPETAATEPDLHAHAEALTHATLIVDTHVDVPYRLYEKMEDISVRTEKGDFDYPRAKEGGLDALFMSIYTPADLQGTPGASKARADALIDMVEKFATDWPDKFAVAKSTADVEAQFAQGLVSLPMGMENGAPIGELGDLAHFYDRGIRYITLAHAKSNQICDSSYDDNRQWKGLSPYGREVVAEMNRLGIMIDVSHVTDDTFYQVMELSKAPVIASHSSCRHFTPGWERNMDDDMIRRLAEGGGVIHINFGSAFLKAEALEQDTQRREAIKAHMEELGLDDDEDPRVKAFGDEYDASHPPIFADIADVVAHVDHVVGLVGIDHVGLGSDFDGVGDSLPTGLKDVSDYPNLVYELLQKGYSEEDVEKVLSGNTMRVWKRVEEVAAELQATD